MYLSDHLSLSPEQIAAEIAEMRKAGAEIAASPRKQREFLRRIGVLDTNQPKDKRVRRNHD